MYPKTVFRRNCRKIHAAPRLFRLCISISQACYMYIRPQERICAASATEKSAAKSRPFGRLKIAVTAFMQKCKKIILFSEKKKPIALPLPPLWRIMLITIISFSGGIKWITSAKESLQIISGESKPPRFCLFPPICRTAFAGKMNAARILWCVLKERAAEENSERKKAYQFGTPFSLGVVLKLSTICFVSSKQIVRTF